MRIRQSILYLVGIAVAACAVISTAMAQGTAAPLKLRVGYLFYETIAPPFFVARDEGIFKALGLDVELIRFDNGTQMTQALVGGSLDGAVGGAAAISSIAVRGYGVMTAPTYVEIDTNQIWASEASGVTTPADLKGKKIAFPFGTTAHVLVSLALGKANLKASDVGLVNTGYRDTASALIAGAVPTAVITGSSIEFVTNKLPSAKRIISLRDFYPGTAVIGGFVASNDFYSKNRDALMRFGSAIVEGQARMRDMEMKKKIYNAYFAKNETFDGYMAGEGVAEYPTGPEWIANFEKGHVASWVVATAQILKDAGTIDRIGAPEKFLDPAMYAESVRLFQSRQAK